MPIHVHHVLLSLDPGGLENGVVNVVNGLDAADFRSSICCLKDTGAFAARIRSAQVPIRSMGLRQGNDWGLPLRLARLFRSTRSDIVHTRNAESFFYASIAARLAGVPVLIHSEHGRTFTDRRLRWHAQRLLSGLAHGIFAVSADLREQLVRHIGLRSERIDVLYNGVDTAHFAAVDRNHARGDLGLPGDAFVIGSIGRLVNVKNYPLLLRAFAAQGDHNAFLVLAGDGPERTALDALATQLGVAARVRLLGHRDDIPRILAALDVFVLCSRSEGMSNTLLEAMAAGLPTIATRVGGNPEILRDGLDGRLVADDDQQALAATLGELAGAAGMRRAMGERARRRVVQEFSMQAMVQRYAKYYVAQHRRAQARAGKRD